LTAEIAGSYSVLAALCISSGDMQLLKKLLIRLWSKEIQSVVKTNGKKKEFHIHEKEMRAFQLHP